jgi:hypothetical protein
MAGFRLELEPGLAGKAELTGGDRLSAKEGEGGVKRAARKENGPGKRAGLAGERRKGERGKRLRAGLG